jgi:hypothetical protein
MKELKQLVIQIFALSVVFVASYLSLSKGWGLEIQSWAWWLGAGFGGHCIALILSAVGNAKDK